MDIPEDGSTETPRGLWRVAAPSSRAGRGAAARCHVDIPEDDQNAASSQVRGLNYIMRQEEEIAAKKQAAREAAEAAEAAAQAAAEAEAAAAEAAAKAEEEAAAAAEAAAAEAAAAEAEAAPEPEAAADDAE